MILAPNLMCESLSEWSSACGVKWDLDRGPRLVRTDGATGVKAVGWYSAAIAISVGAGSDLSLLGPASELADLLAVEIAVVSTDTGILRTSLSSSCSRVRSMTWGSDPFTALRFRRSRLPGRTILPVFKEAAFGQIWALPFICSPAVMLLVVNGRGITATSQGSAFLEIEILQG